MSETLTGKSRWPFAKGSLKAFSTPRGLANIVFLASNWVEMILEVALDVNSG